MDKSFKSAYIDGPAMLMAELTNPAQSSNNGRRPMTNRRENNPLYRLAPAPSPKLKQEARLCMLCRKLFDSSWIGNRMCDRCKGVGDNKRDNWGPKQL